MKAQTRLPLVLHVSDMPKALELTATALKSAGFHMLQASDGAAGLATARQAGPDLVLAVFRTECFGPFRPFRGATTTAPTGPSTSISRRPAGPV